MLFLSLFAAIAAYPQGGFPAQRGQFVPPAPNAVRSLCPCMNTLANHGYLPRDGSSFNKETVKTVFKEVLSVGEDVAEFFFNSSIDQGLNDTATRDTLSLGSINRFGAISHDVSLVRDDRALTTNEFAINPNLVEQFARKSTNGRTITFAQFAQFRKERAQDSRQRNKELDFGLQKQVLAFGEAALFYLTFEDKNGEIPVEAVRSFLGEERLPAGFTKRPEPFGLPRTVATATSLRLRAL
jgi:hypothetical protein